MAHYFVAGVNVQCRKEAIIEVDMYKGWKGDDVPRPTVLCSRHAQELVYDKANYSRHAIPETRS